MSLGIFIFVNHYIFPNRQNHKEYVLFWSYQKLKIFYVQYFFLPVYFES